MNKNNARMISALKMSAAMVGEKKMVGGSELGLGMTEQRDRCLEEAKMVADGLFRVVVIGTFTSGKSTLVNALLARLITVVPVSSRTLTIAGAFGVSDIMTS